MPAASNIAELVRELYKSANLKLYSTEGMTLEGVSGRMKQNRSFDARFSSMTLSIS
jgi:hypothetical protein